MKKQLESREDVELLINTFYARVQQNNLLGYIFNDVAAVDWQSHLPKMYSFWSSILLGEQTYSGNPMRTHVELSQMTSITEKEFNEWLTLFYQTTDELFEGEKAEEAKLRATNIARLMLFKITAL